jgi:nicotinamidase-related amidase
MVSVGQVVPVHDVFELQRQPLEVEHCTLLVIDIQEKLLPPIFQKEQLVQNSKLLVRAAGILKIPTILTSQYAKGLGNTDPEVASLLPETKAIDNAEYAADLRHGDAHLRAADGAGGVARRVPGAHCV